MGGSLRGFQDKFRARLLEVEIVHLCGHVAYIHLSSRQLSCHHRNGISSLGSGRGWAQHGVGEREGGREGGREGEREKESIRMRFLCVECACVGNMRDLRHILYYYSRYRHVSKPTFWSGSESYLGGPVFIYFHGLARAWGARNRLNSGGLHPPELLKASIAGGKSLFFPRHGCARSK
jgi:hypothetical protein